MIVLGEYIDIFSRLRIFECIFECIVECVAVLEKDDELSSLEKLSKISKNGGNVLEELTQKKSKTSSNKMRVIPKADIEMMREDQYERTGKIRSKKYKEY